MEPLTVVLAVFNIVLFLLSWWLDRLVSKLRREIAQRALTLSVAPSSWDPDTWPGGWAVLPGHTWSHVWADRLPDTASKWRTLCTPELMSYSTPLPMLATGKRCPACEAIAAELKRVEAGPVDHVFPYLVTLGLVGRKMDPTKHN